MVCTGAPVEVVKWAQDARTAWCVGDDSCAVDPDATMFDVRQSRKTLPGGLADSSTAASAALCDLRKSRSPVQGIPDAESASPP
jgi:hypothetical protein